MKKIVFEGGRPAEMYPNGIEVEGQSAGECLTALGNFPGFRREDGVQYQVRLPDFQSRDAIFEPTEIEVIRVVEIVEGAGGKVGAFLMVVIGVILIATGVGAPAGTSLVMGGTMTASAAIAMGAMMVLQGVIALMAPSPNKSSGASGEKSNYLNAAGGNTTAIGTRISMVFGRHKVSGHILSFNVNATNALPEQVSVKIGTDGKQIGTISFIGHQNVTNPADHYTLVDNTQDSGGGSDGGDGGGDGGDGGDGGGDGGDGGDGGGSGM